jgi:hypothetical protein
MFAPRRAPVEGWQQHHEDLKKIRHIQFADTQRRRGLRARIEEQRGFMVLRVISDR